MLGQRGLGSTTRALILACLTIALVLLSPAIAGAARPGSADGRDQPAAAAVDPCAGQTVGQLCGRFYNSRDLSGAVVYSELVSAPLDHNWGAGSPAPGVNADSFSARWTGTFLAGTELSDQTVHTFVAVADDGVRLWVDDRLIVDRWLDQAPATYRVDLTLPEGLHAVTMEYYEHGGGAVAKLGFWMHGHLGWTAEYYNNRTLTDLPVLVRNEDAIDYDWGKGSPAPGVNADDFSVRWSGRFDDFQGTTGPYLFSATTDDGMRVWVDGKLILDNWHDQAPTTYRYPVDLTPAPHAVKVAYYEHGGGAVAKVDWAKVCPDGQIYAEYFASQTPGGTAAMSKCEALPLGHDWGSGSPGTSIPSDHFSARYTGAIHVETGVFEGTEPAYTFLVTADDGVRLWVDGKLVLNEWVVQAPTTYRVDVPLGQGYHLVRMDYFESQGGAVAKLKTFATCPMTWRVEYYGNANLRGNPALQMCDPNGYDQKVDRSFGTGGPGVSGIGADNFSIIWTGSFKSQAASYTFTATADDGVRVYVDDRLVIDQWHDQAPTTYKKAVWLPAGYHTVRMEYYEHAGGAVAKLSWARTWQP